MFLEHWSQQVFPLVRHSHFQQKIWLSTVNGNLKHCYCCMCVDFFLFLFPFKIQKRLHNHKSPVEMSGYLWIYHSTKSGMLQYHCKLHLSKMQALLRSRSVYIQQPNIKIYIWPGNTIFKRSQTRYMSTYKSIHKTVD